MPEDLLTWDADTSILEDKTEDVCRGMKEGRRTDGIWDGGFIDGKYRTFGKGAGADSRT